MKKIRIVALFSILLCLLVIVPATFAAENVTAGDDTLAKDYYFDSNIEDDTGDGSVTHPYKNFTSDRIKDNSIVHLANGEYNLDYLSRNNITLIGQDSSKTILNNGNIHVSGSLTLKDVTLNVTTIANSGKLTAQNTIFTNSSSSKGGVISSSGVNSVITLNNCTFTHNSATDKGGAIYIKDGNLNINNSIFEDNQAQNFGGTITCEDDATVIIKKSKISNSCSKNDAGGAIYLINSNLTVNNLEVVNCASTFGGAITSLNSYLNLTTFKARNNKATYNGGALYAMYGELYLSKSTFDSNAASNGGALFVDEVYDFIPSSNTFTNNKASNTGGAVYSIISDSLEPFSVLKKSFKNTFSNNKASINNDVYETGLPDMDIGGNDYILMTYKTSSGAKLPSKYDLRKLGQVTSVKNQGSGGNCWAFAALASLESCVLKATGKSLDLSEENMKNIMSKYSDYGWAMETNEGGYDKMGIGYLTSWLGPVNESDDKYSYQSTLSPVMDSFIHVQNIITLKRTSYTDNDEIKRAIMDYGAVSTSICWKSTYLKGSNYYCSASTESANHAVVIVGWDDNYSKDNFKNTPQGNGAWIIKNSWGASSGDKGYYYVSYYDAKLAPLNKPESTFTFILNDTVRYDNNYQYDIPGKTDYFLNASSTVWYKNKFTATSNEYLAAVSTYFEKATNWDLYIYVNNVLKQTKSGSSHSGYYTIDLRNLIPLKVGDVFEVVFKITVDGEAAFPISESISLNRELYSKGISFLSYDGAKWVDIYDLEWAYSSHTYNSQVACIKAFTVMNKLKTSITLKVSNKYNPCALTAYVVDQYGLPVSTGNVKFIIGDQSITAKVVDGYAKISYYFDKLSNNEVTATFTKSGYVSSTTKAVVNAKKVSIKAGQLTVYYGKSISYSATLVNASGSPVSGKYIKFSINNIEYKAKTNSNGIATVKPKQLGVGTYNVTISFADCYNSNYKLNKKISVKSTIYLPTATKYTLNSRYVASLLDINGNPLKNSKVSIKIGSNSYDVTTDNAGKASVNINLNPGSYAVKITNVNKEVKTQNIKVIARITGNKDLTMYSCANKSYTVKAYGDYGTVKKDLKVSFAVNGKTLYGYTDENGFASISLCLLPGSYNITSSYKGYEVSNAITVKTTIKLPTATKYTYNSKYKFSVLDDNGKALKNSLVSIKISNKTYNKYSDDSGKVSLDIMLKPASYEVSIINGNEVKTQKITVLKRLDYNSPVTMYYGAGKNYRVKAYDDNGKVIKNAKITFNVNGKNYYRYTNDYGNAYFKINLKPGTYKITATYKGYNVSNKIVVKPTLVLSAKTVKRYKTFKYNVKLLNKNGKIVKYKKVTVKFRGKTYKVKTNSRGIAVFKIKAFSKTGKFTLTASYGSAKVSKKITIKK